MPYLAEAVEKDGISFVPDDPHVRELEIDFLCLYFYQQHPSVRTTNEVISRADELRRKHPWLNDHSIDPRSKNY